MQTLTSRSGVLCSIRSRIREDMRKEEVEVAHGIPLDRATAWSRTVCLRVTYGEAQEV